MAVPARRSSRNKPATTQPASQKTATSPSRAATRASSRLTSKVVASAPTQDVERVEEEEEEEDSEVEEEVVKELTQAQRSGTAKGSAKAKVVPRMAQSSKKAKVEPVREEVVEEEDDEEEEDELDDESEDGDEGGALPSGPGGIFTRPDGAPLVFYIQPDCRVFDELEESIIENGGETAAKRKAANYWLLDDRNGATYDKLLSTRDDYRAVPLQQHYIDDCLLKARRLSTKDYVARERKAAKKPKARQYTRIEFTSQDEDDLVEFLQDLLDSYDKAELEPDLFGLTLYRKLHDRNGRHSAETFRNHYCRYIDTLEPRVFGKRRLPKAYREKKESFKGTSRAPRAGTTTTRKADENYRVAMAMASKGWTNKALEEEVEKEEVMPPPLVLPNLVSQNRKQPSADSSVARRLVDELEGSLTGAEAAGLVYACQDNLRLARAFAHHLFPPSHVKALDTPIAFAARVDGFLRQHPEVWTPDEDQVALGRQGTEMERTALMEAKSVTAVGMPARVAFLLAHAGSVGAARFPFAKG